MFIPKLESQFPDVLTKVLNCDCQWLSLEQSVNRSTLARKDKSNYSPKS